MTFDPAAATAGDLDKCRNDLGDALSYVRDAWASDTDARLSAVVYGLEAMMRSVSTLTQVVEREQKYSAALRGRVNAGELRS